jgi:hypothetical protein
MIWKAFISSLVIFFVTPAYGQENPAAADLVGKWVGTPPKGGELEVDIAKIEGNRIIATGRIPLGGSKRISPDVSGEVQGDKVMLRTEVKGTTPVNYTCTLEKNEMPCTTKTGHKTTFKKRAP